MYSYDRRTAASRMDLEEEIEEAARGSKNFRPVLEKARKVLLTIGCDLDLRKSQIKVESELDGYDIEGLFYLKAAATMDKRAVHEAMRDLLSVYILQSVVPKGADWIVKFDFSDSYSDF
jgi:hypothetical protein